MADTHVVSGLKAKEEEIKKRILGLRKEIKGCQEDLEAIRAALRIFGESWRAGGSRLFVIEREGFDPQDQETVSTIRQRCMMAMYRYYDKGKIAKERRGNTRVWRVA
jgi:hypothetical protein